MLYTVAVISKVPLCIIFDTMTEGYRLQQYRQHKLVAQFKKLHQYHMQILSI